MSSAAVMVIAWRVTDIVRCCSVQGQESDGYLVIAWRVRMSSAAVVVMAWRVTDIVRCCSGHGLESDGYRPLL
ncbi:hypothetical protein J6590_001927 [Homalodisca vitripennis]|nr:hypothetical protein J6590_001927 [Homalodisca vitripennis]